MMCLSRMLYYAVIPPMPEWLYHLTLDYAPLRVLTHPLKVNKTFLEFSSRAIDFAERVVSYQRGVISEALLSIAGLQRIGRVRETEVRIRDIGIFQHRR